MTSSVTWAVTARVNGEEATEYGVLREHYELGATRDVRIQHCIGVAGH